MAETINLKVGDELAFYCNYGTRWRIVPIEKITPSGRIHCGGYVLNPDLRVRGASGHSGPHYGQIPDDQIRDKAARQDALEIIRGVQWQKLSAVTLATILKVVEHDQSQRVAGKQSAD